MESNNERSATAAPASAGLDSEELIGLDRRRPLMRVDFTLNIPTIIAIVSCVIGVTGFGFNVYRDLDTRQLQTTIAVSEIRARQDKIEGAIAAVKTDQAVATQALRSEMKGDIIEIKDMLNRLIFGGAPAPTPRRQQLNNDWSKK